MPDTRDLDLTLFGATGFVGRLVAEHLAATAPSDLRIGLAGRSAERLGEVRAGLGRAAADWPLVLADAADATSLRAMAGRSRVVVSTVGPYQRHGLPLVLACAAAGTDYADLTGEVLFVREAIEQAHDTARSTGARIVVSCGFDSVPSDLAVHLLHRRAREDGAGGLTDTTLRVRSLRGGISGGTIDSLRVQAQRMRADPSLRAIVADPEALSGTVPGAPGQGDVWRPFVDAQTGEWVAPFVMASYNTRVVRRSDALRGRAYGPDFRYREVIPTGPGPLGAGRAWAVATGLGAAAAAITAPVVGGVLDRVLPSPGEGPSRERREAGSFRLQTSTTTQDGTRYRATVGAQCDPGYAATAVMLGQAALALVATPPGSRERGEGGVLTPAVALGDLLVDRLRDQGFVLQVDRLTSA